MTKVLILTQAEIKAVLSVLVRTYQFEFPTGVTTEVEYHHGLSTRPRTAGRVGAELDLKVTKVGS